MRPRILAGLGVAGALAFGAFAATGFGNGGGAPEEIATKTVKTHSVAGPPDGVTAAGKRGGLFKIIYKSTDPTKQGLQPYDPSNPPSDVANTTTDQGTTVPFVSLRTTRCHLRNPSGLPPSLITPPSS